MLRRMTGLRLTNHHDKCANEGPIQRSPLSAAVIANAAAIGPRRRVSASAVQRVLRFLRPRPSPSRPIPSSDIVAGSGTVVDAATNSPD
jgi:hypothetical protein